MKRITSPSSIPGFSLDLYSGVHTWPNEKLYWQLGMRRFAIIAIDDEMHPSPELVVDMVMREFPNVGAFCTTAEWQFLHKVSKRLTSGMSRWGELFGEYQDKLVRGMSSTDVLHLARRAEVFPEERPGLHDDDPLSLQLEGYVKVNLQGRDKEILERFGAWLARIRKEQQEVFSSRHEINEAVELEISGKAVPVRKGTEVEKLTVDEVKKRFINSNVLAYLDLLVWQGISGRVIHDDFMPGIVNPNYTNSPETEMRNLDQLSFRAISTEFLASLRDSL
jgi:hypothetical protein